MTEIASKTNHLTSHLPPLPLSLTRPSNQPAMATTRSHGEEVARTTPMNHPDAPSPKTPASSRLTRKRAASINVEEANHQHSRLQDLSLYTPRSSLGTDGPRELICLCIKAPKVPRPRNAFILYRQHYQAQVAQHNPGLANPEISKLIGEQWREQPEEVKSSWKRLAEEEKLRHQRQYPDYRYQPRRGGKGAPGKPTSAPGEDPSRCPKCGGRYIATPRTPSGPFTAATPSSSKMNSMPLYLNPNPRVIETDHMRRGSTASMSVDSQGRRYTQPHLRGIDEDYAMMSPSAPDPKRRRYNNSPNDGYIPGSPQMGYTHQEQQIDPRYQQRSSMSGPPTSATGFGPGPLPRPSLQYQQQSNGQPRMQPPPPPRPSVSYQSGPVVAAARLETTFDESLRLPPLQTQMPKSPSVKPEAHTAPMSSAAPNTFHPGTGLGIQMSAGSQPGARQQVRPSSQFLYKLDMLRAISPPLIPPGPGVAPFETRGPIIAIEGLQPSMLKEVTAVVEKALSISGECTVKIWSDNDQQSPTRETNGDSSTVIKETKDSNLSPLSKYIAKMLKWHHTSEELIKYITHLPPSTNPAYSKGHIKAGSEEDEPKSKSSTSSPSHHYQDTRLPVAVISTGYSLTISDCYASALPITDAYRSDDHWRWVATLWRGIVGADLTVYVKRASEEEVKMHNCVEFANPGVVVLRVLEGTGVDEKLERRLGFEIMEWVRSENFKIRMKC